MSNRYLRLVVAFENSVPHFAGLHFPTQTELEVPSSDRPIVVVDFGPFIPGDAARTDLSDTLIWKVIRGDRRIALERLRDLLKKHVSHTGARQANTLFMWYDLLNH